jgi:hypothetical protein
MNTIGYDLVLKTVQTRKGKFFWLIAKNLPKREERRRKKAYRRQE